jgi:hypothetical protein
MDEYKRWGMKQCKSDTISLYGRCKQPAKENGFCYYCDKARSGLLEADDQHFVRINSANWRMKKNP